MNKAEREVRQLLSRYPGIRLELHGKNGYTAVSANGSRYALGSFGGKQQASGPRRRKNFEAWCKRESGS